MRANQRGQYLVAGIILIAVIALMIATLGYLYVSSQGSGSLHNQSDQAYFAARSGIEYATRQYFTGTACSGLNNAGVQVGNAGATFTLAPTLYAPLAPTATSAALTAASTTATVTSTANYAPHGRMLIDSELINYTGTTATTFTGLTRAVGGTTAAAHASGVTVSQNVCLIKSTGAAVKATRVVEAALGAGSTTAPGALGTMGPDAMMVYGKGTALTGGGSDPNVYYRLWDGTANNWGAEQTAQQVSASSSPSFIVVQFARTRNEAIMGILDGNNNLYIQIWNGRTWTIPAGGGPLTTVSTNTKRTFQIAYEYTSDIARIVYQNLVDPQYATWNGTTLTANGLILSPAGTYPVRGGGTRHVWFRLAPRNVQGSNDILMMSFDTRRDIYGVRWTGAAWSTMGDPGPWDTSTSNGNQDETIDIAWQSDGSAALFVDADRTAQQIGWRTWTAASSTLGPFNGGTALTGGANVVYEWLRLYPDPSNNILLMIQSANNGARPTLQSVVFSGGAFSAATIHDTNVLESNASRAFDFAWENQPSSSGKGWLLWGSNGTATTSIHTRYFTSPATWGATATVQDHTLLVQAGTLSPTGTFVAGVYQSSASTNKATNSMTTTGGGIAWPNSSTAIWVGPTTIQQGERVFVATREGARINTGAAGTGEVAILQSQEP
jgi:hypothetical protein